MANNESKMNVKVLVLTMNEDGTKVPMAATYNGTGLVIPPGQSIAAVDNYLSGRVFGFAIDSAGITNEEAAQIANRLAGGAGNIIEAFDINVDGGVCRCPDCTGQRGSEYVQ